MVLIGKICNTDCNMGLGTQQDLTGMLGQKTGWRGCGGVARAGLSGEDRPAESRSSAAPARPTYFRTIKFNTC